MKIFGIEFSPLSIPLNRRLETFAVFFWMGTFIFSTILLGPIIILIYIICFTEYSWFGLAYIIWILLDLRTCDRGGRNGYITKFVRNWTLWKHFANFFPAKLIKTIDLDRNRNYLVGSHPHGVLSAGAFICFGTDGLEVSKVFPGLTSHLLTLAHMFYIPFFRELWFSSGACSASKASIQHLLTGEGGQLVVLVPGGAEEALNSDRDEVRLILNKRKGFIKIALTTGTSLVPSFTFGENKIYTKLENPEGSLIRLFQEKAQNWFGFAPVIFLGRGIFNYSFGILPHRKPLTVVVGSPIEVEKNINPSQEDIDVLHRKYTDALVSLYYKNNSVYGDVSDKLVIT